MLQQDLCRAFTINILALGLHVDVVSTDTFDVSIRDVCTSREKVKNIGQKHGKVKVAHSWLTEKQPQG